MRRIDQMLTREADPGRRGAAKLNLAVFLGWGPGEVAAAIPLAGEARRLFSEAGDARAELLAVNEVGYLHWIGGNMRAFAAATGASAKEISAALFIGERTVETHLAGAYAKLGVKSRVDLVRLAAEVEL